MRHEYDQISPVQGFLYLIATSDEDRQTLSKLAKLVSRHQLEYPKIHYDPKDSSKIVKLELRRVDDGFPN